MKIFIFILAQIFLTQSSAWAFEGSAPETRVNLQFVAYGLNSLTKSQRTDLLEQAIKNRPDTDRSYYQETWKESLNGELPKYKVHDNVVTISVGDQSIDVILLDSKTVVFDGKTYDFGPGKIRESSEALTRALVKQEVSLFDFLIPSAHAQEDVVKKHKSAELKSTIATAGAIAGGLVAGVGAVILAWEFSVLAGFTFLISGIVVAVAGLYLNSKGQLEQTMTKGCMEAREKLIQENLFSTKEELRLAKKHMQAGITRLKSLEHCKKEKFKKLCLSAEKCLADSITSIATIYSAIDQGDRGSQKVTPAAKDSVRSPAQKNSKQ